MCSLRHFKLLLMAMQKRDGGGRAADWRDWKGRAFSWLPLVCLPRKCSLTPQETWWPSEYNAVQRKQNSKLYGENIWKNVFVKIRQVDSISVKLTLGGEGGWYSLKEVIPKVQL